MIELAEKEEERELTTEEMIAFELSEIEEVCRTIKNGKPEFLLKTILFGGTTKMSELSSLVDEIEACATDIKEKLIPELIRQTKAGSAKERLTWAKVREIRRAYQNGEGVSAYYIQKV